MTTRITFLRLLAALVLAACSSGSTDPGPDPGSDPQIATTIDVIEGMAVEGATSTILPEGPTVQVRDQFGAPMRDVLVRFLVVEGGGSTAVAALRTDLSGRARVPWVLGPNPGTQRVRASVSGLFVEIEATAVVPVPGESYWGRERYVEYLPGELPLVISAPHGGDLTPAEIPDRTFGVTGRDTNTRELAIAIRRAVNNLTGFYPHVIISHLRRIKLDPNREIVEAAQGDPEAEHAWWEFQTYIEAANDIVERDFGEGLYFDLHGHGHAIQRFELGYLLTSTDLQNTDPVLAGASFVNKSSLRVLGSKPGVDFPALIRGPMSFGSLLEAEGIPSVPSQAQPDPGAGNPFFNGGYNTARHGSRDSGMISGLQIETHFGGIRDSAANRQAAAEALARVLGAFFPEHFGFALVPAG